jgi:hypothetical protein
MAGRTHDDDDDDDDDDGVVMMMMMVILRAGLTHQGRMRKQHQWRK